MPDGIHWDLRDEIVKILIDNDLLEGLDFDGAATEIMELLERCAADEPSERVGCDG